MTMYVASGLSLDFVYHDTPSYTVSYRSNLLPLMKQNSIETPSRLPYKKELRRIVPP